MKAEKGGLESGLEKAKEEADEIVSRNNDAKTNVSQLEGRVRALRSQKDNNLKTFGEAIPEVLQALAREEKRFHHRVVGPVGRYVQLKEKKWSLAMNSIIGNLLPNFLVQDFHDANLLKDIFRKYNW